MKSTPARLAVRLLAAALLWACVFFLCLRIGGGGLTLFYEVPPEATGHRLVFRPEGIAKVSESQLSADGTELSVRLVPAGRGETEAVLHWDGLEESSLYESEITSQVRVLPGGILFDSITWNFSGWELFTVCF